MRRCHAELPVLEPNLLPFLDLVFSFIGILVVIFAMQSPEPPQTGRPLTIDDLVVCLADGAVTLYPGPSAEPIHYQESALAELLARLARPERGARNLVFALTRECFATRRAFEDAFARFTSRLDRQDQPRPIFRLTFRPLSIDPQALPRLLAEWRGAEPAHAR